MSEFCRNEALQTNSPLGGTATYAEVWLVLEYSGRWAANAIDNNELPPTIQSWLTEQTRHIPNSRVLFIKKSQQIDAGAFFIAVTREQDRRLYRIDLTNYNDLLTLNLTDIIAGHTNLPQQETTLALVCTNGKRDQCCAKFGLPVYNALNDTYDPAAVWQSTHLSGHRYASVLLLLPLGALYGYMSPDVVPQLVHHTHNNELLLSHWRGWVFADNVRNAAELVTRQQHTLTTATPLPVTKTHVVGNTHTITFEHATVTLAVGQTEPVRISCTHNKYKPQPTYTLISSR